MARGLVQAGHQVTMITEVPNHPHGVIIREYRGRLCVREDVEGIDVVRVWVNASPKTSFGSRIAFYVTFMVNAVWAGLFLARGRYDVIYASSPPLFVGGAALALSYVRRIPMVFEVRDLWPESAVQLGELSHPVAIRLSTWLEKACYHRARHIVAVTGGIHERLTERGYAPEDVTLIPNGANTAWLTGWKRPCGRLTIYATERKSCSSS
jgi:colanic acid biosynthesis glycosyl transferase WcaI